jgi:glycolate oxidase
VFHAGDGNLHPLFSFDRSVPGTLERVLQASDEVVRLCVDAGGALSGEHGIGLEKRDFMPLVFTAEDLAAQACVRAAFDPEGRMNPRKVLPDGAKCGEFALAASGSGDASVDADALPDGSWI